MERRSLGMLARGAVTAVVGSAVLAGTAAFSALLSLAGVVVVGLVFFMAIVVAFFVWVAHPEFSFLQPLGKVIIVAGVLAGPVLVVRWSRHTAVEHHQRVLTETDPLPDRFAEVEETATRLARQVDLPQPEVYYLDADDDVAYTVGADVVDTEGRPTVLVSRGLLTALDDDELEAVLAHELAHVRNGDLRVMSLAVVPLLTAEELDERIFNATYPMNTPLTSVSGVLLWVASAGVGVFSRGRELAADDAAARITGAPGALAAALETLHGAAPAETDLRERTRAVGAMDVVGDPDRPRGPFDVAATHPSVERRVERLRRQARATEGAA